MLLVVCSSAATGPVLQFATLSFEFLITLATILLSTFPPDFLRSFCLSFFPPVGDFVIFCCLARIVSRCILRRAAASLKRFSKVCLSVSSSKSRLIKATSAT